MERNSALLREYNAAGNALHLQQYRVLADVFERGTSGVGMTFADMLIKAVGTSGTRKSLVPWRPRRSLSPSDVPARPFRHNPPRRRSPLALLKSHGDGLLRHPSRREMKWVPPALYGPDTRETGPSRRGSDTAAGRREEVSCDFCLQFASALAPPWLGRPMAIRPGK